MLNNLIIFGANYLIWIIVIAAILFFIKQSREDKNKIIILAVIALPVSYIIAKILAHFYYDPRPFVEGNFIPLIPHAADNGFPSDHTLFGAAITSVIFFFNKKWGIALLISSFLVGLSRVLAGIHHFSDILASLLIAFIITFLVTRFKKIRS